MSNQASTVPTNPTCPDCGTPLAFGALAGMCPACLLKSGASADSVTQAGRIPFIPPTVEELAALFPALEILEFIGKGGMGAVYKARQRQLDRIVALKVLPPALGDDATFAERFAREARALAKLNHPGIVTLYEFGHVTQPTGPLFYILMEFVDGVNLRQLLSGGRISPREALAIVPQICDALQFAHDRGIVHRDIKPENLLIDRRGAVKVADFGLAKLVGNDGRAGSPLPDGDSPVDNGVQQTARPTNNLTDIGKVMGTPRYMAPEQSERPSEVDHRADIYALGVVFYQMLTGELPAKELRPPSTKVQIDVRLDEIVLRALERNPSQRYAAVSEMKTQVETLNTEPLEASSKDSGSTRTMENPAAEAKPDQTKFHISTAMRILGIAMGSAIFLWLFLPKNDGSGDQQTNVAIAAPQNSSKKTSTVPDFQIRRVLTDSDTDLATEFLLEPRSQRSLKVERAALLDGSAIAGAFWEESLNKTNPPNIRVKLTVDGSRKFQEITKTNVNRRLAIMVNGKILSAPNITEEIKGGGFQIPGPRVKEEMDALLKHLNSGSSEFSNLRFGKTNSLTIPNAPRNQPAFLSLEWGLWATNPPAPTHTRRFQDWRRSNNVDLAGRYIEPGSSGSNIPMVLTFSLTLADIGKDSWDRITPEMARLHWNLPDELGKPMDAIVATESAGTYLFRTERDVFGVIEVLGTTPDGSGVRIRYKLVESPSTNYFASPKVIVLTGATNNLVGTTKDVRTVGVWSDSLLLPGESLKATSERTGAGMLTESPSFFVMKQSGNTKTLTGLTWFFQENDGFGASEADEATAQIRDRMTQRPLSLIPGSPTELFRVTNRHGSIIAGSVTFIRTTPAPIAAGKKVEATVRLKTALGSLLFISSETPPGYRLQASDNSSGIAGGNADTSFSAVTESSVYWFPPSLKFEMDSRKKLFIQIEQLAARSPLTVVVGQPAEVFSITNKSGEVYKGFLELVGPKDGAANP